MPLIEEQDVEHLVEIDVPVRSAAPEYKGVTVDTEYIPQTALLTAIKGSPWVTEYYSQVLGKDSAVSGQRIDKDAVYDQYRLVKGMVLRVTNPVTYTQDDETNQLSGTGSANIYPMLIPNVGDMFLADVDDGKEGVFQITRVTRKSITRDTSYEVEYIIVAFNTPLRVADLNSKVIQTYYFDHDFLMHGQNPLVIPEDHSALIRLREEYRYVLENFFRRYHTNEVSTLTLPKQLNMVYEPYVLRMVMKMFDVMDYPVLRQIRELNMCGKKEYEATTVWDAIIQRDPRLLRTSGVEYGSVPVQSFVTIAAVESIRFSGVDRTVVIIPKEYTNDLDGYTPVSPMLLTVVDDHQSTYVPKITTDSYIFPANFYNQVKEGATQMELLTLDYLNRKQLDPKKVLHLVTDLPNWGVMEGFYFMPILAILIKAAIRRM